MANDATKGKEIRVARAANGYLVKICEPGRYDDHGSGGIFVFQELGQSDGDLPSDECSLLNFIENHFRE